jgi:hypothetical protein
VNLRSICSKVGGAAFVALVATFIINYVVRVSDGNESHGLIEEKLFGESLGSRLIRLTKSENLQKWEEANQLSSKLVRVLRETGSDLVREPKQESDRLRAHAMAARAFAVSSSIPREFLAESNPDLPANYSKNFIGAMAAFAAGLEKKEESAVADGIEKYNAFLRWIQSKRREDFKPLR